MLWPEDELIQKSSNNTELTSALVVVTQQRDDILTCLRGVISSHSIDKIPSNLLSKKLKESCDALSLYISAMIGNEQLAKDLSLEVFFNAWIDFKMSPWYSSFDDMVKLIHGWLIDYFKKGKKDIKKSSIINNIDPSLFKKLPDISVQDICDTMDSCVAPIVYGLWDAQWKAWTLHINGLPFDSAGQVIDSTYGAVASSFSLAKSHILEWLRLIVGEKMEITGLVKKNEIIEVSDVDPNAEIAIRKINEHLEYFNNNIFYKEYFPLIWNWTGLEWCFATAIKNGILSAAPDSLESLMSNIVRKLEMYCGEASHTPVQEFLSMGKYCDCLYKFLLQIKKVIPFPD